MIALEVRSDKYLVFNQHQLSSHSAHAHKLLDCSHIPMRGDIIDSVSANNRWIIIVSFLLWLCQPMRKSGRITRPKRYKIFVSSDKGWDLCPKFKHWIQRWLWWKQYLDTSNRCQNCPTLSATAVVAVRLNNSILNYYFLMHILKWCRKFVRY